MWKGAVTLKLRLNGVAEKGGGGGGEEILGASDEVQNGMTSTRG